LLTLRIRMARDDFGPQLRLEREWRGITLEELAATTKVSVELWEALERNDFSRWPSGVFARAFVRDYATAVGLDADAVVNDFCRYFPNGDRRTVRIVRQQAALIGHQLQADDAELLPAGLERRQADRRAPQPSPMAVTYGPRIAAAAVDLACVSLISLGFTGAFGSGFLPTLGVSASLYFAVSTVVLGRSPGQRAIEAVRLRVPRAFNPNPQTNP
jgi:transcriptional regulator with XRE-family HTH domain